ncbi:MAG: AAA family ATPase, partial [Halobacteriaceae archaeon]
MKTTISTMDNVLPLVLAMSNNNSRPQTSAGPGGGESDGGAWKHFLFTTLTLILANVLGGSGLRWLLQDASRCAKRAMTLVLARFLSRRSTSVVHLEARYSTMAGSFDSSSLTREFKAVSWHVFDFVKMSGTPVCVKSVITGGSRRMGLMEKFDVPVPLDNGATSLRVADGVDVAIEWKSDVRDGDPARLPSEVHTAKIRLSGRFEDVDGFVRKCVERYAEEEKKTTMPSSIGRIVCVQADCRPTYKFEPRPASDLSLHTRVEGTPTARLAAMCRRHARGYPKMVQFGQSECTSLLLHGAPGTGKTTAIMKYAKELELQLRKPVYVIQVDASMVTKVETLREIVMSNTYNGMYIPPEQVVVVFEEIDCGKWGAMLRRRTDVASPSVSSSAGDQKGKKKHKKKKMTRTRTRMTAAARHACDADADGYDNTASEDDWNGSDDESGADGDSAFDKDLTLSYFLEIMDGLQKRPRKTYVATTNHPEFLDPAVCRPGRFGKPLEFLPLLTEEVCEMFEGWKSHAVPDAVKA